MCNSSQSGESKPEEKLAKLLRDETGSVVDAKMLRLFLRANWSKVTALAHRIHEQDA